MVTDDHLAYSQAPSGPDTTVAFAVLLLKQLLDRGAVSAGGQPWEGCREAGYGRGKSQGRDGYRQPGRPVPQLHALVLTRNRDIASRVVVRTITRLHISRRYSEVLVSKGPR